MTRDQRTPPSTVDLLNQKALILLFISKLGDDLASIEAQLSPDHRTSQPIAAGSTPTCEAPTHVLTREGGRPTEPTPPASAPSASGSAESVRPLQLSLRPLQLILTAAEPSAAAADQRQPAAVPFLPTTAAAAAFSVQDLPSLPLNAEAADGDEILSELAAAAADARALPLTAAAAAAADSADLSAVLTAAADDAAARSPLNARSSALLTAAAADAARFTVSADSAAA